MSAEVDARVQSLCEEYSLVICPVTRYPQPGETRATDTIQHIWDKYGDGHIRMVLSTVAETANNKGNIDKTLLWAASDLVLICNQIIERDASSWLEFFDGIPLLEMQAAVNGLRGKVPLRPALVGMIYGRVVRHFGPQAIEPDLFGDS